MHVCSWISGRNLKVQLSLVDWWAVCRDISLVLRFTVHHGDCRVLHGWNIGICHLVAEKTSLVNISTCSFKPSAIAKTYFPSWMYVLVGVESRPVWFLRFRSRVFGPHHVVGNYIMVAWDFCRLHQPIVNPPSQLHEHEVGIELRVPC